jgi:hypothetical protein
MENDNPLKPPRTKCRRCHLKNGFHKMSCPNNKKTISEDLVKYYEQMEREVHKDNNKLNE